MMRITDAVKHLLIVNVIFYLVTYFVPNMQEKMLEWFALFYPTSPFFKPWQFVTHMFMHGGLIHILFNMYALWAFGSPLEQLWGRNKFFFFYFSAGLGAAAVYTLSNYFFQTYDAVAVGASGAIYGVLVAFAMNFPNAKLALIFFPVPVAAKYFIPLIIIGDLYFGFTGYSTGNIAHFAHVGGALIGFLIMLFWKKNQFSH
ncbi:MAG: rhomboid family intramembrane serine protease [Flavobacteriales bacterium]|nr:MAG: rhomboid family intramembrane serine protease [Flavobacteriales bacterium]PIE49325.1 MAG: rhomboid family intramembrane serine protease [Flavobacteriales bacterium]